MIDAVLVILITWPILGAIYGGEYFTSESLIHGPMDFLLSWVLPAIAVILFWRYKGATPGKMVFSAKIVNALTGQRPSMGQLIGRYFAYILSFLGLCLGFLWIGWDRRKQGWHDKLAGTVVVTRARRGPEPVRFPASG
jgi:uncharacterized RDD family membrane protein YckC